MLRHLSPARQGTTRRRAQTGQYGSSGLGEVSAARQALLSEALAPGDAPPGSRALLQSQAWPFASRVLTAVPTALEFVLDSA